MISSLAVDEPAQLPLGEDGRQDETIPELDLQAREDLGIPHPVGLQVGVPSAYVVLNALGVKGEDVPDHSLRLGAGQPGALDQAVDEVGIG